MPGLAADAHGVRCCFLCTQRAMRDQTYGHLLEFMGDNLPDFLNNINRLHTHLLKGAHFPEVWPYPNPLLPSPPQWCTAWLIHIYRTGCLLWWRGAGE
jgi:hypothetical protein